MISNFKKIYRKEIIYEIFTQCFDINDFTHKLEQIWNYLNKHQCYYLYI